MNARASLRLFPRFSEFGRTNLYAIGFQTGAAKIGITTRPRDRFSAHWTDFGQLEWIHLFPGFPRADALAIERSALTIAAGSGCEVHSEVISDVTRDDALNFVRSAISSLYRPRARREGPSSEREGRG